MEYTYCGANLTPFHSLSDEEPIAKAYDYVDSIIDTADDPVRVMWHGWALREAFLAGRASKLSEE